MDLSWMSLPSIDESALDDAGERRKILEYLYSLNEQLRYVLMNLDESNFTEEFKETLDMTSDVAALTSRVEDSEAGVVSLRKQTAEGFSQTVRKDQIISAINQSAELIQIMAGKINLNGYVSINGAFSIDENGYMHASSGGQIGNWVITNSGLQSANGSVTMNGTTGAINGTTITGSTVSGGTVVGAAISGGSVYGTTVSGSTISGGTIQGANGYFSGILGTASNGWYFDGYNCQLLQNGSAVVTINGSSVLLSNAYSAIGYGNLYVTNSQLQFGNGVIECLGQFRPADSGARYLGGPSNLWNAVWASNGTILTSDRAKKNSIAELDSGLCEAFIMALKPSSYKMNDGTSGRTHFGLIAQEVEEAMAAVGLTGTDFAGLIYDDGTKEAPGPDGGEPVEFYGLRYDEFIAPLIRVVQRQEERIAALEARLGALEVK